MTRDELKSFLQLARRFRATPIVDDDFPSLRDQFDAALDGMVRELAASEEASAAWCVRGELKKNGILVLSDPGRVCLRFGSLVTWAEMTPDQADAVAAELTDAAREARGGG